jgi:ABC-type transport system involved in cytochrome c biogenesis permease subunit
MKRFLPLAALVFGLIFVGAALRPPANETAFDLVAFGRLPVLANGRLKPLDTVARTSLLQLRSKQTVPPPDYRAPTAQESWEAFTGRAPLPAACRYLTADEWLARVLFDPEKADTYRHFRIDNSEVLDLLGLSPGQGDDKKYFSFDQLRSKLEELDRQAQMADGVDSNQRTPFQRQLLNTRDHVVLYVQLKAAVQMPDSPDFLTELQVFERALPAGIATILAKQKNQPYNEDALKAMKEMADRFSFMEQLGYLRTVPPPAGDNNTSHWRSAGTALVESFGTAKIDGTLLDYARLGHAWRAGDSAEFNRLVQDMLGRLAQDFPQAVKKTGVEQRFNYAEPFYRSSVLYVCAFLLAVLSWLTWPKEFGLAAFYLVATAWVVATGGILARMWIEGRPPVTNLYSSALLVGWVAATLCLVLEKLYRNGIGSAAAGATGFATLLIAHHLALGGDTLEMMRAVLDSNFWLSTHVVTVVTGYGATFLAGFLALIYIFRGIFTRSLDKATADALTRMVYGIVCFATLFSLIGTVLGGIWADQSWGRFWGWDPKENGALIIVIWNAVILHARWGGMIKQRGLMIMAVFGNIVTSWSWFGVNMLGVGLHSYGFMESAFYWLIAFVASQLLIMALASRPLEKWRSFRPRPANA